MLYKKTFSNSADGIKQIESIWPELNKYEFQFVPVKAVKANSASNDIANVINLSNWSESKNPCSYGCYFYKFHKILVGENSYKLEKKLGDSNSIHISKQNDMYEFRIELNPESVEDYEELRKSLSENNWTLQSDYPSGPG